MSHQSIVTPDGDDVQRATGVLRPALERLGMPMLLFGATFLILVIGSAFLVTPERFPVRTGGTVIRIGDLTTERDQLLLEQGSLLQKRREISLWTLTPVLHALKEASTQRTHLGSALLAIKDVQEEWGKEHDAQSLTLSFDRYDQGVLEIQGAITHAHEDTMQSLASLVDMLRVLPDIRSVTEPEYIMETLKDGSKRTPFSLRITLAHAT